MFWVCMVVRIKLIVHCMENYFAFARPCSGIDLIAYLVGRNKALVAIPSADCDVVQQRLDRMRTYYELLNMPFEMCYAAEGPCPRKRGSCRCTLSNVKHSVMVVFVLVDGFVSSCCEGLHAGAA